MQCLGLKETPNYKGKWTCRFCMLSLTKLKTGCERIIEKYDRLSGTSYIWKGILEHALESIKTYSLAKRKKFLWLLYNEVNEMARCHDSSESESD